MKGLFTFSCLMASALAFGQIQNGSFESWASENPTGWETGNGGTFLTTNVTNDSHSGANAAELSVLSGKGFIIPGLLGQTVTNLPSNPTTLTFWLESEFIGNTGLTAAATVFDAEGNVVAFGMQTITENYSDYTEMEVAISPIQVGAEAVSAYITLYLSDNEAGLNPEVNSIARIDDVSFDGLPTGVEETDTSSETTLYPNPTNGDIVFIDCAAEELVSVRVCDALGKLVEVKLEIVAENTYSSKLDISSLPIGNYFIIVEKSNSVETLRLQKK